jgi:hypothetical protein
MLIMFNTYMYVVDRDFGFAPNPFHGYCTLATCKPRIRAKAELGDWVIGMGGSRLKATGRCVFAMKVTSAISFDSYWSNPLYNDKKPVRNGSAKMMVGDNIYHRDAHSNAWHQADSHHSNPDGTPNAHNIAKDTKADRVLLSSHFFFFGQAAPAVPTGVLKSLEYRNPRDYLVYKNGRGEGLVEWLVQAFHGSLNLVVADPFDFERSEKRYSGSGSKII